MAFNPKLPVGEPAALDIIAFTRLTAQLQFKKQLGAAAGEVHVAIRQYCRVFAMARVTTIDARGRYELLTSGW